MQFPRRAVAKRRRPPAGTRGYFPPRQIQKTSGVLISTSTNAQTSTSLITNNLDGVTLVRMVGNLSIRAAGNAGATMVAFVIVRQNETPLTLSVATGSSIYSNEANILWSQLIQVPVTTNEIEIIPFDIRAMRKMKSGDQLYMLDISSVANCSILGMQMNLFAKMP